MILMMLIMALPLLGIALFFVLPWRTALPVYLIGLAISLIYHRAMMRSQKLRVRTGIKTMIGRPVTVISWQSDHGTVRCGDEIWSARALDDSSFVPGSKGVIVDLEGLELVIRPSGPHQQFTRTAC
jgi:membrane protein implicated in regulation of membrane protease activity